MNAAPPLARPIPYRPPMTPPLQAQPGRAHYPMLALLSGIMIPGAGQAYNGQPIKGFFLLFFSVFIVPYFYSLYDAYATANKIVASGGRMGKGGLVWVWIQSWLAFNVILMAVVILSAWGVLA